MVDKTDNHTFYDTFLLKFSVKKFGGVKTNTYLCNV